MKELNRNPLPEEDWQYHVSINHTAMCENTENIAARLNLGICYFPEQQARMDVLLYEISQADAEEVNTSTGKKRRFDISSNLNAIASHSPNPTNFYKPDDITNKYMGLFNKKSKHEIEIEREISYRKAKAVVNNYIGDCESIKKRYWEQGIEAARTGDEEMLKRFAAGYFAMADKIKKGKKLLLHMEGIKIQRDAMRVSSEFVAFAKEMSDTMVEGSDVKDLAAMQAELDKTIMKAEQMDSALSAALDMTNETLIKSSESDMNLDNIVKTMEGMAGESRMDPKIEERIKHIEEAMKKEVC